MNFTQYNKYLVIIAPYSISVSALYLFGYWGSFGINIFEYISLSDIIKISLYQLVYYGAFVILGSVLSELFLGPLLRKALPPGEGADLPEAKFFRKFWRIPIFIIVAYALYIGFFTDNAMRWFIVGALLAPIVAITIGNSGFLSDVLPSDAARNAIIFPMIIILFLAYGWGNADALTKQTSDESALLNKETLKKIYIGRAGNYLFLWNKERRTVEIYTDASVNLLKIALPSEKSPIGVRLMKAFEASRSPSPNNEIQPTPQKGAAN